MFLVRLSMASFLSVFLVGFFVSDARRASFGLEELLAQPWGPTQKLVDIGSFCPLRCASWGCVTGARKALLANLPASLDVDGLGPDPHARVSAIKTLLNIFVEHRESKTRMLKFSWRRRNAEELLDGETPEKRDEEALAALSLILPVMADGDDYVRYQATEALRAASFTFAQPDFGIVKREPEAAQNLVSELLRFACGQPRWQTRVAVVQV